MEERRKTKPGVKRLSLVFSVLLCFVLGIPFWRKLTEIHRTPLPYKDIEVQEAHLNLPCHFNIILTSGKDIDDDGVVVEANLQKTALVISDKIRELIDAQNSSFGGCGTNFNVAVSLDTDKTCLKTRNDKRFRTWPCGLSGVGILDSVGYHEDDRVDELLWDYAQSRSEVSFENGQDTGGAYTIVVLADASNRHDNEVSKAKGSDRFRAVLGKHRHAWITGPPTSITVVDTELAGLISILAVKFFMYGGGGSYKELRTESEAEKGESMPLAANGKVVLSFSLLNAEPKDWIFDWDFNMLEEIFLSPVVDALRPITLLEIESQVLYYVPKAVPSIWDEKLKMFVVQSKDLPFFVNANEWHLDTSTAAAGRSKLLQFALYIPAAAECPLKLNHNNRKVSQSNGFTSPGWGGVVIHNPCNFSQRRGAESLHQLSLQDLQQVMQVFIAQLRSLFGLKSTIVEDAKNQITGVPASRTGFAEWEVDILLRRRATADIVSCTSTLKSLSRLVRSLPNMVIMDEIGNQVWSSLSAVKAAREYAFLGMYSSTAEAAQRAREWAEEAFFQPSIMSLLYFPLEHHFAIYTPFFVPVLLQTFLAAFREAMRYRKEWRKYQQPSALA